MRIPLEKAYLCESCGSIDDRSNWCDGCASGDHLAKLSGLLNRTNSLAPSGSAVDSKMFRNGEQYELD